MSDSSSSTRGASGPGTVDIVKHSEAPVPGFLEEVFRERGYRTRVVDRASGDGLPRDGDKGVGTLVLGGPMGVYEEEDFPFLREERRYLRDLVRRGEPVLCICLGAQLLATALGGKAYPGGATEVGWHRLQLTEPGRDDPLLKPFVGVDRVLQWHGDTFDLPDGAVHLASSPTFENQAFRVGRRAYGIQFHPEIEESTVRGWID